MSKDPLNYSANWKCLKCDTEMLSEAVQAEQEEWEEKIENAPKNVETQKKLLEELLLIFQKTI